MKKLKTEKDWLIHCISYLGWDFGISQSNCLGASDKHTQVQNLLLSIVELSNEVHMSCSFNKYRPE